MNRIVMLIMMCVCVACSPEQRIARIARNHNISTITTKTVKDTIVIPAHVKSLALPLNGGICASSDKDLSVVGMVRHDTVYISVSRKSDTVIVTRDIPTEVVAYNDNDLPFGVKLAIIIVILLGLCFVCIFAKILKR